MIVFLNRCLGRLNKLYAESFFTTSRLAFSCIRLHRSIYDLTNYDKLYNNSNLTGKPSYRFKGKNQNFRMAVEAYRWFRHSDTAIGILINILDFIRIIFANLSGLVDRYTEEQSVHHGNGLKVAIRIPDIFGDKWVSFLFISSTPKQFGSYKET